MLKRSLAQKNKQGQHLVEYIIVIGVVVVVLMSMTPLLKWGFQGMIKVVADQVGNQQNADQAFDERGHLLYSYTTTRAQHREQVRDFVGETTYIYTTDDAIGHQVEMVTEAYSNLGHTKE